ncbi:hypothetical protein GGR57DRAFT_498488 [Xylariaceae sp. FL1272]|nr:hypothetical protein GGR57DRAFT_498488 [Xylariaceae sp. FL1272]
MTSEHLLHILAYVERLLRVPNFDKPDHLRPQTLYELSGIGESIEEAEAKRRAETLTMEAFALQCVSGILFHVQLLYDTLPAIGSIRQLYCFREPRVILQPGGTEADKQRQRVSHNSEIELQDLDDYNSRVSEATAASLRTKTQEDLRMERRLFDQIHKQLLSWIHHRSGPTTDGATQTLDDIKRQLAVPNRELGVIREERS